MSKHEFNITDRQDLTINIVKYTGDKKYRCCIEVIPNLSEEDPTTSSVKIRINTVTKVPLDIKG